MPSGAAALGLKVLQAAVLVQEAVFHSLDSTATILADREALDKESPSLEMILEAVHKVVLVTGTVLDKDRVHRNRVVQVLLAG